MPTYEYICSHCGNQWEEVQRISEPPIQVCPKCASATAKRQISGGSFILKGGGWYADLYSSSKPAAKEDGGESKAAKDTAGKDTKESPSGTSTKTEGKDAAPAKAEPSASSKAPAASTGPAK
jgi:putative FmdB family regulatory protein